LQAAVFAWRDLMIRVHPELRWYFAIPNANKRSVGAARWMIAEGMTRGVWDTCLPVPRAGFGSLWIEHKVGRNKLTDDQREFGVAMLAAGNACVVSRDFDTTRNALTTYLNGRFGERADIGAW
jgi:hypothetical protein